jgi:hypothetical protein
MRVYSSTIRLLTLAAFVGALACARNPEQEEGATPEEAAAARDTATDTLAAQPDTAADTLAAQRDTAGGQAETPPGYQGMERDTTLVPETEQTATDTFLQQQGQGQPQDTAGYGGLEKVDTTGQAQPGQTDTTGVTGDTTGMRDTTGMTDTTGQSTDTTGYNPSQQQQDSVSR